MSASTHVAFVRAVMIGREGLHRQVLLDMFRDAGAEHVVSYLSTGNVSFRIDGELVDETIEQVAAALGRLLGRPTPLFVRRLDELVELVDRDPFADAPIVDVYARLVTFLPAVRPHVPDLPMVAPNGDWTVFAAGPAELFSVTRASPDRQPQDPGGVIQRAVGAPVTTRAIGTIERIVATLI
jgi:uncharacterized protein (DUF1697 family)